LPKDWATFSWRKGGERFAVVVVSLPSTVFAIARKERASEEGPWQRGLEEEGGGSSRVLAMAVVRLRWGRACGRRFPARSRLGPGRNVRSCQGNLGLRQGGLKAGGSSSMEEGTGTVSVVKDS
jgi:hypothetical protein